MKSHRFLISIAASFLISVPAGAEDLVESAHPSSAAHEACVAAYSQLGLRVGRGVFFASRSAPKTNAALVSFQTFDGSWVSSIDMNWILRNPTSAVAKLLRVAESQRKRAYQRLAKFKNQDVVTAAENADKDLLPRTVYLINTSQTIDTLKNNVHGGIRVVFARSQSEKLPWEIDLGRTRSDARPAAEFGRLYSNSNSSPETVIELINSAAQVASQLLTTKMFHFESLAKNQHFRMP